MRLNRFCSLLLSTFILASSSYALAADSPRVNKWVDISDDKNFFDKKKLSLKKRALNI